MWFQILELLVNKKSSWLYRLLLCLLVGYFSISYQLENEVLEGRMNASSNTGFGGLIWFVLIVLICFLMVKVLVGLEQKSKPKVEKDLEALLLEEVGELEPVGENTFSRTKLIKHKNDIETYVIVTKVDKSQIKKSLKKQENMWRRRLIVVVTTLVLAMIVYLQSQHLW